MSVGHTYTQFTSVSFHEAPWLSPEYTSGTTSEDDGIPDQIPVIFCRPAQLPHVVPPVAGLKEMRVVNHRGEMVLGYTWVNASREAVTSWHDEVPSAALPGAKPFHSWVRAGPDELFPAVERCLDDQDLIDEELIIPAGENGNSVEMTSSLQLIDTEMHDVSILEATDLNSEVSGQIKGKERERDAQLEQARSPEPPKGSQQNGNSNGKGVSPTRDTGDAGLVISEKSEMNYLNTGEQKLTPPESPESSDTIKANNRETGSYSESSAANQSSPSPIQHHLERLQSTGSYYSGTIGLESHEPDFDRLPTMPVGYWRNPLGEVLPRLQDVDVLREGINAGFPELPVSRDPVPEILRFKLTL
jgi:hypothetical protein